ncbi:putative outer membrane protein Tom13 [Tricharina praecox]|uniref:putative outer membrane protein Tom13 n=1 Tax=Tricharina praecox TaxID=43433 RepID=UPI0022208411|nr:putative outer membrane protein Tom13 [Tricharina praecox]KAI5844791.1 putative outer membrane protein Tom13 [Tricharina praecox]
MASPSAISLTDENASVPDERPASPLILYKPPTAVSLLRTAAINLVLPFINGLMLGFGELFAHELAFRWGWGTTRIFPLHRLGTGSRPAGPGVEIRDRSVNKTEGFSGAGGLEDLASLE